MFFEEFPHPSYSGLMHFCGAPLFGMHVGMFNFSLGAFGTEEQKKKWLTAA